MRILLLSQFFDPEPSFKGLAFARELARRGHSVQVLTGFPNYPGGKVYPGYKVRAWQQENMDGIPVLRVPLYPSHDKSSVRRVLNYSTFSLSAATLGVLEVQQPDVVYVYHPPTTIAFPSTVLRLFRRVPIVADIQDLWPDTVLETGMLRNQLAISMLKSWCRFAFRQMDRIVVQSPGFKQELIRRGVPEQKIDVIYNWCDESAMRANSSNSDAAARFGLNGRFKIMFAGTMGVQQGLDTVLETARLCNAQLKQVQFVFVGGGIDRDRLETEASRMRLSNVLFLPRQSPQDMGPLLSAADVLLVHLRDLPLFRITIPSKTQAYLAAGRPVIMAVRGDAADLVKQANGGFCCAPEQPAALVETIRAVLSMSEQERVRMGADGAAFYKQNLSLSRGVDRFENVFEKAIALRS
jgi:glycosyltransferase involved in cell wall biosynthesis